jgi:hypothetical protein
MVNQAPQVKIGPHTSLEQLFQFQIQQLMDGKNIERKGKFPSKAIKVVKGIDPTSFKVAAFDPFWSSTDDKERFLNYGFIDDKVSTRGIVFAQTLPVFDQIVEMKTTEAFGLSFLLRVPYSTSAWSSAVKEGDAKTIIFANKGALHGPSFVTEGTVDNQPSPSAAPEKVPSAKDAHGDDVPT